MKYPIYPCLWFDSQAAEAANFYCSVFNNSRVVASNPMVATFEAAGQKFMCLNGGPIFKPNPSISFYVLLETKDEIEQVWMKLKEGGSALMPLDQYPWSERYGWVQDRFGISWQLSLSKIPGVDQKFSPVLMFTNDQANKAEQAIKHYTSIFENSSVISISKYKAGEPGPEGTVQHAQFKLDGHVFMAMDSPGQHAFTFNEGISFVVECETQKEIDYFWSELTEGGSESMCGWLKDKFGVSWQIVPTVLGKLMSDPQRSGRVVQAFLKMKKFDIETLLKA
jgi:predicted 3-demethylubiquinone-9 3-methyltransferase (glyoxalase superfamily)